MSSRSGRRAFLFGSASTLLAGCGFQPLYGDKDYGAAGGQDLATVKVNTIPDRNGQILHNFLLDRINPHGRPGSPLYSLDIQLTEQKSNVGIIKDSTATLGQLANSANYTLYDLRKKSPVHSGRSRSFTSYQIVQSQFATLAAEKDARERTLRELAEDITTKVAVFLASQKQSG